MLFFRLVSNDSPTDMEGLPLGHVKLIDFGFSTFLPPNKKLRVFCGTPSYM